MPERNDTVSNGGRGWAIVRRMVFRGLPRQFVPRQMVLFALLLGDTMRMRRAVLQFGRSLVVLVMRCVIVAGRHMS